nr:GGDEF domain-containing protein [Lachnospiraceae bacterium]
MLIILLGTVVGSKNRKQSTVLFMINLILAIYGAFSDSFSYIIDGNERSVALIKFFTMSAYITSCILLVTFTVYMVSVIMEKSELSYDIIMPVAALSVIDIIFLLVGFMNGKLFYIEDYSLMQGPWKSYVSVLPAICILYLYCVLIRYIKIIGIKQVLAFSAYMFLPVVSSVMLVLFDIPDYTYTTVGISFIIIYVIIQAQIVTESNIREEIFFEASHIDSLTGLKNRRTYEEELKSIEKDINVGVVFCDINMLKQINDSEGHEAGDELIKKFAKMLTDSFSDGAVFRISGDEFVVILDSIKEDEFNKQIASFSKLNRANDGIASCGYLYGSNKDIKAMVNEAEEKMYEDKDAYYKRTGYVRRR